MKINPANAALIVIDMQTSFCDPEKGKVQAMGLDVSACKAAIEPCSHVLSTARAAGIPVIFTRYVYEHDYSDGGIMVREKMPGLAEHGALKTGSQDSAIVPELVVEPGDTIIDKNRPSSFFKTNLDDVLASLNASQLIVCGVTTNCCVETTVRDASQRDLEVFVISDACGELDDERHRVSLRAMDMLFADVITAADLTAALNA